MGYSSSQRYSCWGGRRHGDPQRPPEATRLLGALEGGKQEASEDYRAIKAPVLGPRHVHQGSGLNSWAEAGPQTRAGRRDQSSGGHVGVKGSTGKKNG